MEQVPRLEEHPVQRLLSFAEQKWGPRFDENGKQLWWCDDSLTNKLAVTNGTEYFEEVESPDRGVLKLDVRQFDRQIIGASTTPIHTPEDADSAYIQVFWH